MRCGLLVLRCAYEIGARACIRFTWCGARAPDTFAMQSQLRRAPSVTVHSPWALSERGVLRRESRPQVAKQIPLAGASRASVFATTDPDLVVSLPKGR